MTEGGLVTAGKDFAAAVDESHAALGEFVKGDPDPLKALFSQADDVSLGNPFGPFRKGWKECAETMERAATLYRDGRAIGFDGVSQHLTADLACIAEVERYEAKVGGRDEVSPVALRVTTIFRLEDGTWKIVHRHADPIVTAQAPESVIQRA
jgi:ketosteroid isomerase-like protein